MTDCHGPAKLSSSQQPTTDLLAAVEQCRSAVAIKKAVLKQGKKSFGKLFNGN